MALLLNNESTKSVNVSVIHSDKNTIIVLFNDSYASDEEKSMVIDGNYEYFNFGSVDCDNIEILDAGMKDIESTSGLTSDQFILTLSVKR